MINRKLFALALAVTLAGGCSSLYNLDGGTRGGVSSSLVDYLYPGGEVPPEVRTLFPT